MYFCFDVRLASFILNDKTIVIDDQKNQLIRPSTILLDFIRYEQNLKGTKVGCREGDCGACTVLLGELYNGRVVYKSINSCLTPLGNVFGKHVLTIEGLNLENELNIVQNEFFDKGASQCGFCTTGFIMSISGKMLSNTKMNVDGMIEAIDGNICRCTGYKPIERAINSIVLKITTLEDKNHPGNTFNKNIFPNYLMTIPEKLQSLAMTDPRNDNTIRSYIGGGTDIYVQKPDEIVEIENIYLKNEFKGHFITTNANEIVINSGTTFSEFLSSEIIQELIPEIKKYMKLIASTPIRNTATIGGNIVNASPIGDLSIILLALNSTLSIKMIDSTRKLKLNKFFLDYKKINLKEGEIINEIIIEKPIDKYYFNFEKVSKRTHLDIATVNTAIIIQLNSENKIFQVQISAGGVAPIPKLLEKTCSFLLGKALDKKTILESWVVVESEIAPITDIRGTKEYKSLLLRQLYFNHFLTLFPNLITLEDLF